MPTVNHRGCSIHYRVSGTGPLLVLQHGFFGTHAEWKRFGYVDALKTDFTVATVDSLAHGKSDRPVEKARYAIEERAGDVVAVIDDLGFDRAHVLGYSMGGWIATGVAMHYPERLTSLSIGGWNCVDGMGPGLLENTGKAQLTFDEYMSEAKKLSREGSLDWVTGDAWTALAGCYEQLYDIEGSATAVGNLRVPVLLYAGQEDSCHDPTKALAVEHGLTFLSLAGDHVSAMKDGAQRVANALHKIGQDSVSSNYTPEAQ